MADGDIEYDNGEFSPLRKKKNGGGLIALLLRTGFAKDERQANTVLLVVLALAIVVGVGVWFVL